MPSFLELWNRLRDRLRRDELSSELDQELRFHAELLERDHATSAPRDSTPRGSGRRQLGNLTYYKEDTRAMWSLGWPERAIDETAGAVRHAFRALRRAPSFAIAVAATLAVGIGATTAVFSVISAALLQPLPYANAQRLVAIQETRRGDPISVSVPDLLDLRAQSASLAEVAGFVGTSLIITGDGEAERLRGQIVTSNLFRALGVRPAMGRDFTAAEEQPGSAPVVELSYDIWQRRYGGDPAIVGRAISIDDRRYTIVGVMPRGFHFPDGVVFGPADLWLSFSGIEGADRTNRDSHPGVVAIGLLQPGRTLGQARAELDAVAHRLSSEYPRSNQDIGVKVDDVVDVIVGSLRESLILLLLAVGLVLVIACANVAGLVLTRADARRAELAVRVALGAGRWRMAASLIAEAAILAVAGGVAGIAVAVLFVHAFAPSLAGLPRLSTLSLDWRALFVAAAITVVAALAACVSPVVWARRVELSSWLGTRASGSQTSSVRARSTLVVAQIALSLVLVSVTSLLLQSFERMRGDRGGIDPRGVLTFAVHVPDSAYRSADQRFTIFSQMQRQLAALPGAQYVGAVSVLPFSGSGSQSGIAPFGGGRDKERRTDVQVATPDYFRALGIDLVAGRTFVSTDRTGAPPVAVVDEWLAKAFFPGESAIGKHLEGWGLPDVEIVGVVRHVTSYGVAAPSRQQLYVPHAQRSSSRMRFVIRTTADPLGLVAAARQIVAGLDPNVPIYETRTMESLVETTVAGPRLAAFLSTAYSTIALVLVLIGVYGVMAYVVLRRTHEIGVRLALGAPGRSIFHLVVAQAIRLAAIGIVVGSVASYAAARAIAGLLFGVGATDPLTFGASALGMAITVVVAAGIPAARATMVSPVIALSDGG